ESDAHRRSASVPAGRALKPRLALFQEPPGPGLAVFAELFHELATPIQLRSIVELTIQGDARDLDRPEHRIVDLAPGDRPVDELDELELLLHRQVPGQLVAPVQDLVGLGGNAGARAGIDLDHPELIDV